MGTTLRKILLSIVLTGICLIAPKASAGVELLSETEFRELANQLAQNVTLFKMAWFKDPKAEFAGGVPRDYIFWVKGQFLSAHTRDEALAVRARLLAREVIESKEFIDSGSDVDIYSDKNLSLEANSFGVTRIEVKKPDILKPGTTLFANERLQGFLPVEKIRLQNHKIMQSPDLGDGVHEIYSGVISVHYSTDEEFARSYFAKSQENHPIIYALRFIRAVSANYRSTVSDKVERTGDSEVDSHALLESMDPVSREKTSQIFALANKGEELKPYLNKPRFEKWVNLALKKAMESFVSPTASQYLFTLFNVDNLPLAYPSKISPISSAMYGWKNDPAVLEAHYRRYNVNKAALFQNMKGAFPDGFLYHGTPSISNARSIIARGIRPSTKGNSGFGVYGVSGPYKDGIVWEHARSSGAVLKIPVDPTATVLSEDPTEFMRLREAYKKDFPDSTQEELFRYFGIDIAQMDYVDSKAYIVKNASVLGKPSTYKSVIMPFEELLKEADGISDPAKVIKLISSNDLLPPERQLLWQKSKVSSQSLIEYMRSNSYEVVRFAFRGGVYWHRPEIINSLIKNDEVASVVTDYLLTAPHDPQAIAFIEKIIGETGFNSLGELLRHYPDHPELTEKYIMKPSNGAYREDALTTVLSERWAASHPEWFEKIVDDIINQKQRVSDKVFTNPILQRRFPYLFERLIKHDGGETYLRLLISKGMMTEEAVNHPEWYFDIVERYPTLKRDLQRTMTGNPSWVATPWKGTKLYDQLKAGIEPIKHIRCEMILNSQAG